MPARGQALSVPIYAWDVSTGKAKTGDAGNITPSWIKDGVAAAPATATVSEISASLAPGWYKVTITGSEATCDLGVAAGKSATANVEIVGTPVAFEQLPTAAPGANGGLPTVDGNNRIAGIQGTITNLNNLDAAITSRLAGASYTAPDNATIAAIAGYVDTEVGAILAAVDTEVGAIKTKTDQLLFTAAGNLKADIEEILGVAAAATALSSMLIQVLEAGTFRAGSTVSSLNLQANGGGKITPHQAVILVKITATGRIIVAGVASVSGAGGATPTMVPEAPAALDTAPGNTDTYVFLAIAQGDDPLASAVPGSYIAGSAGYKIANIDTNAATAATQATTAATQATAAAASAASAAAGVVTLLTKDQTYPKNVGITFLFPMRLTDGTQANGVAITVSLGSPAGFAAPTGGALATQVAVGWFTIVVSAAEMNVDEFGLTATGPGCNPFDVKVRTQS